MGVHDSHFVNFHLCYLVSPFFEHITGDLRDIEGRPDRGLSTYDTEKARTFNFLAPDVSRGGNDGEGQGGPFSRSIVESGRKAPPALPPLLWLQQDPR